MIEYSLAITHPELIKEWHPTKNGTLTPFDVSKGMVKKVWWQCQHGHEWESSPNNRTAPSTGCPYCAGNKIWPGFNDLATTHPELAKEWHPTKNKNLNPFDVSKGTVKKVWWLGSCGHEWEAQIGSRATLQTKCPYCTGRKVLAGFNDLATTHPEVANEWHPTLNEGLTPQQVSQGSNKKVWWQCRNEHVWRTAIFMRTRNGEPKGVECPTCRKVKRIEKRVEELPKK